MTEMIKNLGNRMVSLVKCVNLYTKEWSKDEQRFSESRKLNKFDHELNGMVMALKAMDINYEFHYDEEVTEIVAIEIAGIRFEI